MQKAADTTEAKTIRQKVAFKTAKRCPGSSCQANGQKGFYFLYLFLFLVACQTEPSISADQPPALRYQIESAQKAIQLARTILAGDRPEAADWEALFRTEGYQHYLCNSDEEAKKAYLKEAFLTAFDESRHTVRDSLLAAPLDMNMEPNAFRFLYAVRNLAQLRQNLSAVDSFLAHTEFSAVLESANARAREFLPQRTRDASPELHEVTFVSIEPNFYVLSCGLILDAHLAWRMGEEDLINTVAHEFHHNYRALESRHLQHPFLGAVDRMHREGLADLIDKPVPPVAHEGLLPAELIDDYNRKFAQTPAILQAFDSLTVAWKRGELALNDYDRQTWSLLQDGHANGFYMALLVKNILGQDSLVEHYANPRAFLYHYNEAAAQTEGEYVFSNAFLAVFDELYQQLPPRPGTYSDETFQVTFRVTTPNASDDVYITGNRPALGDWDPAGAPMERRSDNEREITLTLRAPIEFKFTRGNWETEGFVKDALRGPNLQLGFAGDTTVTYQIEA